MSEHSEVVHELSIEDQRAIDGGVAEGGCIGPAMQKFLDILNRTTTP